MRILLTGADGYLGSAIMAEAERQGVEVMPATLDDADLRYAGAANVLLKRTQPDVIIHCAAQPPKNHGDYDTDQSDNLAMVENLLPGDHRFVFASSMTVHTGSAYGRGKLEAERLIDGRGVSLRLPGLFGEPRRSGLLYNAAKAFLRDRDFIVQDPVLWSPFHVQTAARCCLAATTWPCHPLDMAYPSLPDYDMALGLLWILCGRRGSFTPTPAPRYQPNIEAFVDLVMGNPPNLSADLEIFVIWLLSEL